MPRSRREMIHFYELQLFLLIPTFERNQSPRILYNVADWQPVRRFERARALTLYAAPWLPYFLLLLFLLLLLLLFFYSRVDSFQQIGRASCRERVCQYV